MRTSDYWIDKLKLQPHPEGGFYKETYRSTEMITLNGLPSRFPGARNFSTAIYFLLRSQERSHFHRIKSDELWHFHEGSPLHIYVLQNNKIRIHKLGMDIDAGEAPQIVIPGNCWFGAKLEIPDSYTLASCTVAPGFDFMDFEMGDRNTLLGKFPEYNRIITNLTS